MEEDKDIIKDKKSNKKKIIILCVCILLVATLSTSIWFYIAHKINNDSDNSTSDIVDNETKKEPITLNYEYIGKYSNGLIAVSDAKKVGFIDANGKLVIPMDIDFFGSKCGNQDYCDSPAGIDYRLDNSYAFKYNMLVLWNGKKFGVIDTKGEQVIPFEYDNVYGDDFDGGFKGITIFDDNTFIVVKDHKYGIVDKNNKIILPIEYDLIYGENGLAIIEKDKKFGVVNNKGKSIIDLEYDLITLLTDSNNSRSIIVFKQNEKYGYANANGEIILPIGYQDNRSIQAEGKWYSDGLISVVDDMKWGVIDETGKFIIVPTLEYYTLRSFSNELARVEVSGKSGFIDKSGKLVIDLQYISNWQTDSFNDDGLVVVATPSIDGSAWNGVKSGVIDKNGNTIIPLEYGSINIIDSNHFIVADDVGSDCNYWLIDKSNEKIGNKVYNGNYALQQQSGLLRTIYNGKYGVIDYDGNIILDNKYTSIEIYDDIIIAGSDADTIIFGRYEIIKR